MCVFYIPKLTHKILQSLWQHLLIVSLLLFKESVCATYGSGITVACVVDVGDQKTSISCVEDGISHRASRYELCP